MDALTNGLFLSAVNTAVVNYLAEPVRRRWPEADLWWLLYVALISGFVISWFSGVNLFEATVANELLGRILSGLLVGGGSSLIHNVFGQPTVEAAELVVDMSGAEE